MKCEQVCEFIKEIQTFEESFSKTHLNLNLNTSPPKRMLRENEHFSYLKKQYSFLYDNKSKFTDFYKYFFD